MAILTVIWAHDARRIVLGQSTDYYQSLGWYGVILFFAISGVLISWRIQEDERKAGEFSLKSFYTRRFFRIQPPQWVYLAVVALLMCFKVVGDRWKYWWGAVLPFENFLWHSDHLEKMLQVSYLVAHFWTLAVEEHFYLLISLFFFRVKRKRALVLAGMLVVLLTWQQIAEYLKIFSADVSYRRTYWMIQYLMVGALAAILLRRPRVSEFTHSWLRPWVAFLLTFVIMLAHHLVFDGTQELNLRSFMLFDQVPLFFCFTLWVVATLSHPASWTTRFLELPPMRFIGRISYSLYLWHILFVGGARWPYCTWHPLNVLNGEMIRYPCAFGMAVLSYYFVEKPMIRLGHRLAPPATPGHRDLNVEPVRAMVQSASRRCV